MTLAYCNHGRWVADCATPYCGEAHTVNVGDVFACQNCGRTQVVSFPNDKPLIDAALSRRVVPETRNWVPGETVTDLITENREHEGVVN